MEFVTIPPSGPVTAHAFRLKPKAPLKETLCRCAEVILCRLPKEKCSSLFVMTVVGSLRSVKLRLANASKRDMSNDGCEMSSMGGQNDIREWKNERFEIVSMTGTFSRDGSCHLHISISDDNGHTFGGHLLEGEIFTTAEVVLGSAEGIDFPREHDDDTGYRELIPKQIPVHENMWIVEIGKASLQICIGFMLGALFTQRCYRIDKG